MENPPRRPLVAISACLLGHPVRYDGNHKRQPLIVEQLQPWFEWLPLCPEMAAGLGTPRPPVQLVGIEGQPLALGVDDDRLDVTPALDAACKQLITQLRAEPRLGGVIVQSRSPSCGLGSTPLHNVNREPKALGSGLFARHLHELALPCVEESWLDSPARCRRFLLACLQTRVELNPERTARIFSHLSNSEVERQLAPLLGRE